MLTKLTIRNFKLFEEVEIELGERVVFIGPNNSGKTSALQAIALWDIGVKRWLEKRSGDKKIPAKRPGVTINRQDLISIPVPSANLLWHDLRVRMAKRPQGRKGETHHVRVEIGVEGMDNGQLWQSNMEFDCANEESIYCRPPLCNNDTRMEVPLHLKNWQVAYLPPMSGLAALKEIGFEHYSLAKETGWVLYLEGSTDLAMLRAFAERLNHNVSTLLERPFVHYVANQPKKVQEHFYGLREAKGDLVGIAVFDRLDTLPPEEPTLFYRMWKRCELENYLCQRETLLAYAEEEGRKQDGELLGSKWRDTMEETIREVESALTTLGKNPWSPDIKASDVFLEPVFKRFYEKLQLPNIMSKTNYHILVKYVPVDAIDKEIGQILDDIVHVANQAQPSE